jgi:hypothetical protein
MRCITPPPSHAADIAPPKGKQQEEQQDSDDAAGAAAQPGIRRYAPFTTEKRKKVTGMVQEFFRTLDAYAKEENIDLTAVTKCFNEHLTSMKRSPWQAFLRLFCIQRRSGSKHFNSTALFLHIDIRCVFQTSILKACLMLLLDPGLQLFKMKGLWVMKAQTAMTAMRMKAMRMKAMITKATGMRNHQLQFYL